MNQILGLSISIIVVLTFANPGFAGSSSDSSTEKKAIERLFSAWNARDADKLVAAFSDDVVYEDVAAGKTNRGKDEVRRWAAGAFADIDNFKLEVVRSSYYKGGGTAEWIWSGTDKGLFKTGKSFSVRGVSVIEVRGGKVSSYKGVLRFRNCHEATRTAHGGQGVIGWCSLSS